jgi:anti-sigma factor RsiW
MKDLTHENVLLAMMAAADGESAATSPEEIESHLSVCADCREEAVRMQLVSDLFQQASRRESAVDLWSAIDTRLDQKPARSHWKLFVVAGVLLLVYKVCEMLPEADPGWAIKLVPLLIFGALLVFLKENPFRINTELVLEK